MDPRISTHCVCAPINSRQITRYLIGRSVEWPVIGYDGGGGHLVDWVGLVELLTGNYLSIETVHCARFDIASKLLANKINQN